MTDRRARLPLVLLLTLLAGCGGSGDETASAPPTAEPTRSTSPTSAATSPTPAASSAAPSESPAQISSRQLCENTEIIDRTLTKFIESGPGPGLAEQVRQFTGQLATYKNTFRSEPKGAAAADIVTLLERQGPGWEALYGEGETAYQEPKANGSNLDVLGDQIEAAWPAAMTALGFTAANTPHAPVPYAEGEC